MTRRACPKCGSENVDVPRTYETREPSPRFVHAQPECLDCGQRGEKYDNISDAFKAWEVA
jgi:predicted RNA-binding Zn-ribbon protein involved in translation (DUF1610 family)